MKKYLVSLLLLILTYNICSGKTFTFVDKHSSYIEYTQWDAAEFGNLTFSFRTNKPYGLLLYSDNYKNTGTGESFINLKLKYGKLVLTIQMGGDDYKSKQEKSLKLEHKLNDLKWHVVRLRREKRVTILELDDDRKNSVILENKGEEDRLFLNSGIFIGGISKEMERFMIDRTVLTTPSRFSGCIRDVNFSTLKQAEEGEYQKPVEKYQSPVKKANHVQEGCHNACDARDKKGKKIHTCENKGVCVNQFTFATCNCIGTGYGGDTCTEPSTTLYLNEASYISIELSNKMRTTATDDIKLRFRSSKLSGIILAAKSKKDHLMVELFYGKVRFSIDLGGGNKILVVGDILFSDSKWHLLEIFRIGNSISMTIDKKYPVNSTTPGHFSNFDLQDLLYLGGHPDEKFRTDFSESKKNFDGCLQQVYYNDLDIIYKVMNTKSYRFRRHGNTSTECPIVVPKKVVTRTNEESNVVASEGTKDHKPEDNKVEEPEPEAEKEKEKRVEENQKQESTAQVAPKSKRRLSKSTMIWLIAGIIVGTLFFVVAVSCIVYHLKNRYSGVFISGSIRESNKCLDEAKRPPHNMMYTPGTRTILMKPERV